MDQTTFSEIAKKPIEERTEKEIELTKIFLQRETNTRLTSIQKNLQFFFWITIISIVVIAFAYIISES